MPHELLGKAFWRKLLEPEALLQSRPEVSVRSCTRFCIRDRALLQSKPELSGLCYRAGLNCEEALLQSMPRAEPKHCSKHGSEAVSAGHVLSSGQLKPF